MIIEKTGTGATIEEAFEEAKRLLDAPEDAELHQEILEYPKKKLFSRVPAKIKVWYEIPDAPAPKAEPVAKVTAPAPKAEPKKAAFSEKRTSPAAKKSSRREEGGSRCKDTRSR